MTDPDRVFDTSEPPRPGHHVGTGGGIVRPVLWLLLVTCAAANVVTSSSGVNIYIGVGFGLATLACATALIVHHYRRRAR